MSPIKVVYIVSDIDKALAFEWIAMNMDRSRFELSFLILNPGPSVLEQFLTAHGFAVRRLQCRGKKDWPAVWMNLFVYLRKHKPDIVHCHLLQANILGLTAAACAGIRKRIYTRHHSDYHFRYFPKGVKWDRLANRLATKVIAPSEGVRHILTAYEKVEEQKIKVINHGFDLSYFRTVPTEQKHALREKYNEGGQTPVIGVISRFTELKGIQYIIPAFRQLLDLYPRALLLLFNASGDYAGQLNEQLRQTLPPGSYKTIGFEQELSAAYTLFDIFVQVSTDTTIEAFGQTYVEALAAGIPSVFTLSGIAPDFIADRENALVVPFRDSGAIFGAMKEILSDVELKNKIIEGGWNSVQERFSLHTMISGLSELYTAQ